MLFRRRKKQDATEAPAAPLGAPVAGAPVVPAAGGPVVPAAGGPVVPATAEDGARELALRIMRAAPDVRYRAARGLGLLEGLDGASGPELERGLLERARAARMLAALDEAIAR